MEPVHIQNPGGGVTSDPLKVEALSKLKRNSDLSEIFKQTTENFVLAQGFLATREGNRSTGISVLEFSKALKDATKPKKESFRFWKDPQNNDKYLVKKVNEGATYKSYWFVELNSKFAGVFKRVKKGNDNGEYGSRTLRNELRIFNVLASDNDMWGIQSSVQEHIITTKKHPEGRIGLLTSNYDMNYELALKTKLTIEQALSEFHQLAAGVMKCHSMGIGLMGIRINNIYLQKENEFTFVWNSDFRAACTRDDPIEMIVESFNSIKWSEANSAQWQQFVQAGDKQSLIEFQKAFDIYCLGIIFGKRLKTHWEKFPLELRQLISDMTDEKNYKNRPAAEKVFLTLDGYITKHHKALAETLQKMRSLKKII